ncbi:hypothetical protein C8J57DRAFT_1315027 [Mycena rebaudengoi]|nr:hypothetical protein C8J57DRAFT_1315027 [Mycena rebaudengoi]
MASVKKPPQKKRHTKPCRYFQTGRCPQSAEDCDFAHVFSDKPAFLNSRPCRYYLAGNCGNTWCQYAHVSALDAPPDRDKGMQSPPSPNIQYGPVTYIPSNQLYVTPPWSPFMDAFHMADPRFFHDSTVSSPTSSVSDDTLLIPVDDPYFADPQAPLPYPALAPMYDILVPKHPPPGLPPRSPRTSATRQKLASYKTKPCRYHKPGSVCPNGASCTFIHVDADIDDQDSPTQLQHELPSRPVSSKEENTRKGYFPISWRVIGGGVLVGGSKADPDDEESDFSEDSLAEFTNGRSDPVSKILEISIPAQPSSHVAFPSTADETVTPTGQPARQRATSIPSAPNTSHIDVFRLFSAESPGVL